MQNITANDSSYSNAPFYYVSVFSLSKDNKLTLKLNNPVEEVASDSRYYPILKSADKVKIQMFGGKTSNIFSASPSDTKFVVFDGIGTWDGAKDGEISRIDGSIDSGHYTQIYYIYADKASTLTPPSEQISVAGSGTFSCATAVSLQAGWNEVKLAMTKSGSNWTVTLSVLDPMDDTNPGWSWTDSNN
jgi:hypothetical protein